MMSIDEVIQYCIDISSCKEQREEYRELSSQIVEWLGELKRRREADIREYERNIAEVEAKLIFNIM